MKKIKKADIEASILAQLKAKGAGDIALYEDLVATYMDLYTVKEKFRKDIKERGVKVKVTLSTKVEKIITNESVQELMFVNQHMLLILDKLGIKPSECAGGAGIDDDM